jgi:hypothetical protein
VEDCCCGSPSWNISGKVGSTFSPFLFFSTSIRRGYLDSNIRRVRGAKCLTLKGEYGAAVMKMYALAEGGMVARVVTDPGMRTVLEP